ncbi:uncharacterized protein EV422DRAFT_204094 [Fimicolochytrium jonesii]|uniref:uncharacterized protein n=1 Tax=Fimicolochytrium jonesii TaxID=1396493 RepID=UPI0022FF3946|nr:uncharacterized protein EV422DRAFT_204094 [Fimicolochytrium jonesii]KAI8818055.1 hypothetical protein EV422DRAFT_204094 [Fimicolochytrium jonesii]
MLSNYTHDDPNDPASKPTSPSQSFDTLKQLSQTHHPKKQSPSPPSKHKFFSDFTNSSPGAGKTTTTTSSPSSLFGYRPASPLGISGGALEDESPPFSESSMELDDDHPIKNEYNGADHNGVNQNDPDVGVISSSFQFLSDEGSGTRVLRDDEFSAFDERGILGGPSILFEAGEGENTYPEEEEERGSGEKERSGLGDGRDEDVRVEDVRGDAFVGEDGVEEVVVLQETVREVLIETVELEHEVAMDAPFTEFDDLDNLDGDDESNLTHSPTLQHTLDQSTTHFSLHPNDSYTAFLQECDTPAFRNAARRQLLSPLGSTSPSPLFPLLSSPRPATLDDHINRYRHALAELRKLRELRTAYERAYGEDMGDLQWYDLDRVRRGALGKVAELRDLEGEMERLIRKVQEDDEAKHKPALQHIAAHSLTLDAKQAEIESLEAKLARKRRRQHCRENEVVQLRRDVREMQSAVQVLVDEGGQRIAALVCCGGFW